MNRKLELDLAEALIAAYGNNGERVGRILSRLSFDDKEKLARALFKLLSTTLLSLPGRTPEHLLEEYGFEIVPKEVAASES